jgi:hypothetical protein
MLRSAVSVQVALYWLLGWVLLGWRSPSDGGRFIAQEPNSQHLLQNTISPLSLLDLSCPYSTCQRNILPIKEGKIEKKRRKCEFPSLFCFVHRLTEDFELLAVFAEFAVAF